MASPAHRHTTSRGDLAAGRTALPTQGAAAQQISWTGEVRQEEWSVLVTDQPFGKIAPHICVLFRQPINSGKTSSTIEKQDGWGAPISWVEGHVASELRRFSGLPDSIATLTHEQLEPVLVRRPRHPFFFSNAEQASITGSP
jgi:hypothetical protein